MPPKGWKKPKAEPASAVDAARICELLSRVPTDAFVLMTSTSGLTRDEVRELCEAFKRLKE